MIGGERFYRVFGSFEDGTVAFRVQVETTDLLIRADRDLTEAALALARKARGIVAGHGREFPAFLTSLAPLAMPHGQLHPLLSGMYLAAQAAQVGPMAAVAGAVAEYVARELKPLTRRVTVENGGDVFIDAGRDTSVGIFAGASPFSGRLTVELDVSELPVSVCTSSGTVGPSISFGLADAATVVAKDCSLADAAATALGNGIKTPADIAAALEKAMTIPGVLGVLAIMGDKMGCMGAITLGRA